MDRCVVFYSWQSDMPNSTNRGFIQKALEEAAKSIRKDDSIEIYPVIDRDTSGVPGSPDIVNTIFSKIDTSDIFACDVTIINQSVEPRPTPNPNVLIELGYAIKTLGLERIIMIMNTAFGGPDLLPFDLSKKRILPYHINNDSTEKSAERKKLTHILTDAIKTITSHTDKLQSRGKRSGVKDKLKEECERVLHDGNKQDWRELVDELWRDIPGQLLEWKTKAEQVWNNEKADREAARLEAVEICLPSLVPIFVAIENGRIDMWEESVGPLRQLLLLWNKMGGGCTDLIDIGSHMLYFAGNLGMAIAARIKQLDFINKWMQLPMPGNRYYEAGEISWVKVNSAHYLWGKYMQDRFQEIIKVCESKYLSGFFTDTDQLVKYLFLGNLGQSLYELSQYTSDESLRKSIEDGDTQRFRGNLSVHPVWVLMETEDFKAATWELFDSSDGVLKFVFPSGSVSIEQFWTWWKNWKAICVCCHEHRPFIFRRLTLPGEPNG